MPFITPDYVREPLYVITAIFNPVRYKSRWKHYERFAKYVKDSGAVLITVEAAFHERHHALDAGVTQYGTEIHQAAPIKDTEFHKAQTVEPHQYIKVRVDSELWLKENLINIGMSMLPADAKYVAWVDADTKFARDNWVGETIQQLQHYKVVQMFSHVTDLGPRYAPVADHLGFMYCYLHGIKKPDTLPGGYYYQPPLKEADKGPNLWHPGYAWAARRESLDALGGLIDFAILGAGDNHMAHALIGEAAQSIHPKIHEVYRRRVMEWQWRTKHYIREDVGYVSGLLLHYWHGKKVDRKYWDRWKILVSNKFNPDTDIKYDSQGALVLVDRFDERTKKLRDDIRAYNRERNEDSIDV